MWHLGFNDTYLYQEFWYNVDQIYINSVTGQEGAVPVYEGTVCFSFGNGLRADHI